MESRGGGIGSGFRLQRITDGCSLFPSLLSLLWWTLDNPGIGWEAHGGREEGKEAKSYRGSSSTVQRISALEHHSDSLLAFSLVPLRPRHSPIALPRLRLDSTFNFATLHEQLANILKEVQIMRGLTHPSIVRLFDFTESREHYFLTLEYVISLSFIPLALLTQSRRDRLMEGGELFHQIVKLTYFSEELSRHVIMQVAQGIRYLHEEKGVVHRFVAQIRLERNCTDDATLAEISNRKTSSSTLFPSFPPRFARLGRTTRRRRTRESFYPESEEEESDE